jgi:hypothetical protein
VEVPREGLIAGLDFALQPDARFIFADVFESGNTSAWATTHP